MAFGNRTKRKERDERQIALQGTSHRNDALLVEGPAVYHIFADDAHPPLDALRTSAIGRRLVRRVRYGSFVEPGDNIASGETAGDDRKKLKRLGCGVRVYKSQFAFAFRSEKQMEIETLQLQGCIVLSFRNLTRRAAGLLRFDGGESDGCLLPEFLQAALTQIGIGDEVRLDVHGGAFTDGEARPDTLTRRDKVLVALEGVVRQESANHIGRASFPDHAIRVDWTAERSFNLRVWTWDGNVALAPCPSEQRQMA